MKLNLGCGENPRTGYLNFDKYSSGDGIQYMDLEKLPLGFETGSADEILLYDTLEHLFVNPYDFMLEIHRILKKGSVVRISLPFFGGGLTHVRCFHTKQYFKPLCDVKRGEIVGGQTKILFNVVSIRTRFNRISRAFPYISLKNYYVLEKI